jgi:DMSO/TMAO reductase YedYZ molybdopterin-dependent catalytic subunit
MNTSQYPSHRDSINRRDFIRNATTAAAPLVYFAIGGQVVAAQENSPSDAKATRTAGGLIVREKEPLNLEMPFGGLDGFITPTERFYVRCHFPIPQLDTKTWRLKVEGAVTKPFELTLDELREMQSRTTTATLECAGNSRVFLTPTAKGAQWERGAVGNAEWSGVPLGDVLKRAGLKDNAVELILEGADEGEIKEPPRPAGKIHFARSVPRAKALDDVLLAMKMNGRELTPTHGFPMRAIVPGWYGMAHVKWLTRIIATATPFRGHFQTIDYATWQRPDGAPTQVPITELEVKTEIARPEMAEIVTAGSTYRLYGAAWTANAEITKVEVSFDSGATWKSANLVGKPIKNAWQLWELEWQVPAKPGKATLMARATDSRGRTQPEKRDADRGNYIINHLLPIEIEVR